MATSPSLTLRNDYFSLSLTAAPATSAAQLRLQRCIESRGRAGRGKRRVLRSLEVGQGFGELALQVAGGQRAATIKAKDATELLTINGFEYRDVLAVHHRRDIAQRVRSAPPRAPCGPSQPRTPPPPLPTHGLRSSAA